MQAKRNAPSRAAAAIGHAACIDPAPVPAGIAGGGSLRNGAGRAVNRLEVG